MIVKPINLEDNTIKQSDDNTFSPSDIEELYPFAGKNIKDLCRENENLLVFPYSIDLSDDKIGDSPVMSIVNTGEREKVYIQTGNVMGFVGVGNLQIKIKSRFDQGRDDYFLHYMLQRVMSYNLFDLNHNNEYDDVFDFVMLMFPYFLKNAVRQGIYREYQNYKHNDSNVKGPIDIGRHITKNIPFVGNIAYNTREYSHDNSMTELIRHTIEFMKTKKYGASVLEIDRETKDNVKAIVENTPLYNSNDRSSIISKNLRHKSHIYYTDYLPLQALCLQILRMEEVKYGETDDEICGILFDGAWLWEEYINTILCDYGFVHPENKKSKGAIYLFEDHTAPRYPDFYKDGFVLDAKYKKFEGYDRVSQVSPDDIHQVITYMQNLKSERGGFIVPLTAKQDAVPTSYLKGTTSTLSIFGIEIETTSTSYSDFCDKMKGKEEEFVRTLNL